METENAFSAPKDVYIPKLTTDKDFCTQNLSAKIYRAKDIKKALVSTKSYTVHPEYYSLST